MTEIPLPDGSRPATIAFDAAGHAWVTLDGTWALARFDPATENATVFPLTTEPSGEHDALWGLTFAADGSVWTASRTHAHRVDPETSNVTAYPLPVETLLSGDVHVTGDGVAWVALVTADAFARVDPETGDVTLHEMSPVDGPGGLGPLLFHDAGPSGLYFTATYAGTFGVLDPETGESTLGPMSLLQAPTGLLHDGGDLWITEHGASTIARVDPEAGEVLQRYPTTPSPYYPASGPTGVLEHADGTLWFAAHFADRITRLDPNAGTLHEFEVPSAPGANIQRVAEDPEGRVWFAAWSVDRIGYVDVSPTGPDVDVPERVIVTRGERTIVPVERAQGELVAGNAEEGPRVAVENGTVVVEAGDAIAGEHLIVIASEDGPVRSGRYVTVEVVEPAGVIEPARTPAVGAVTAAASLMMVALIAAWRRGES